MPIKRVQFPDGSIKRVEVPEGATNEQIIEFVASQHQPQAESYVDKQKRAEQVYGRVDPTEGMPSGMQVWEGLGRSMVDTGRGVQQALGMRSQEQIDEDRRLDAPLMARPGGMFGNIVGQTAQMALPVPAGAALKATAWAGKAAPYVGAAARSGAFGATQGVGSGETRAGNAGTMAALGAAGQGVSALAARGAQAARSSLTGPVQESVQLAQRAGIPLHLSQVTDSRALKTISSALNYLPLSGAGKAGRRQQEAFNEAVSRSFGMGQKAPQLTDEVMREAGRKFNEGYGALYAGRKIQLDSQAMNDLFEMHRAAGDVLEADQAAVVRKQIENIIKNADEGGFMPGEVYQNLRSKIRERFGNGSSLGNEVMAARKVLDKAASRSLGPEDAAKLDRLNGGYANYKTAQDALKQVEGSKGNIKPSSLWNLIKQGSTQEMRELAKIGQSVLKDPIPDSGTAPRELVYRALALGGGGAGAASALGMLVPAAKVAAAGMLGGRFLNSKLAERMLGHGRPSAALAKAAKPANKGLPALFAANGGLNIVGGQPATQEDIERDAEIVRRFRQGR